MCFNSADVATNKIYDFLPSSYNKMHAKIFGLNYWYYLTRLVQPIGRVSKAVGILSLCFCLREVTANSISSETRKFRYVELIAILHPVVYNVDNENNVGLFVTVIATTRVDRF